MPINPVIQPPRSIQAISVGSVARRVLENTAYGSVVGATSRGIFLRISTSRVIFLSQEVFRGPMTINLPGEDFPQAELGNTVEILPQQLRFGRSPVRIHLSNCPTWSVPAVMSELLPAQLRDIRLREIAGEVIRAKGRCGLSALFGKLIGISNTPTGDGKLDPLFPVLLEAQQTIQQGRCAHLAPQLACFFGLGSGLTPSGDDLLMGLLLCLNRFRPESLSKSGINQFNQQMVKMAYEKTTSLSANLIECAAQGQADERLIKGLDGIYCDTLSCSESVKALLAWGHSSGLDALLGFAIATPAATMEAKT
ncbi:MAG: DUF2877 domain-containing protein [Anaerolineaceae bacterium]|nr:DUF2877 domain-containing protein [Anaerolineaceae bacterium]